MSKLLSKSEIAGIELKNKIIMAPMCMYKSDNRATVKTFHLSHYSARAIGGVGLIIVEATAVEPRGRISDNDLGIWNDEQLPGHKELVDQVHQLGSKIAIQIAHAGRKSTSKETTPVAPSALAFSKKVPFKTPVDLSLNDIEKIKQHFIDAAKRSKKAGYDMIELHAAHGYLLCEFLSPLTNQRNDIYGSSLENRCKLVIEISTAIKKEVNIPIIVRISADEWMDKGWNIDDSIFLSQKLEKVGVDAIHVSAGGNHEVVDHMPELKPLYQCEYAKKIKENVSIPVIAVGLITTPKEAEEILENNTCDFVAYGRELLRSPNFVYEAANIFNEKENIEESYKRAYI